MKRCPICGEKYSETYKKCPFCEEEEALQNGGRIQRGGHRAGKRAASRSQQPNLLSPILVILIIIMAALLIYLLFGDKIQDKLSGGDETSQQTEEITPVEPDITDDDTTEGVMPGGDAEDPDGTDSESGAGTTDQEKNTTPSNVDSLPETLTMSYLGTPKTEFTMSVGDAPIPLTASGGNGKYTWSSSDEKVATVSSDGKVSAVAAGRATITLTDGSAKGTCLVIVKGGSASTTTSSGSSTGTSTGGALKAGAAVVVNGGNGVFVRSGPSTSSEALATISNGASVQIVKSAGNGWYQITFAGNGGANTTGYMKGEYLSNS